MIRITLAMLVAAAVSAVSSIQTKPAFTGTWVMDEQRSGSATHDSFVAPVVWTLQQSPHVVILQRQHGDKSASFTYPIREKAPAATPNSTVNAPSGDAPGHHAYWDGNRLILETLQNVQGKTVTTREVLLVGSNEQELVVERVLEVEHGYTMKGAQNFSAVKDIFTRTK
jgi:hypothetical protein